MGDRLTCDEQAHIAHTNRATGSHERMDRRTRTRARTRTRTAAGTCENTFNDYVPGCTCRETQGTLSRSGPGNRMRSRMAREKRRCLISKVKKTPASARQHLVMLLRIPVKNTTKGKEKLGLTYSAAARKFRTWRKQVSARALCRVNLAFVVAQPVIVTYNNLHICISIVFNHPCNLARLSGKLSTGMETFRTKVAIN